MSLGSDWGSRPATGATGAPLRSSGLAPDFLAVARARRERSARVLWNEGARRLRGFGKPLVIAWLANVVLALIASLPIYAALDDALSRSRWATLAARRFDLDWFLDFRAAAADTFAASTTSLIAFGAIAILLSVFLSGGLLGRLRAGTDASAASFLADCARHFGRFLTLFIASSAFSGLVVWVLATKRPDAFDVWLFFQQSDFVAIVVVAALIAIGLWLLVWIHMAQDLGRLAVVVRGSRAPLLEFVRGLGIAFRHFGTLARLYLWTLLGGAVVTLVYLVLSRLMHGIPGRGGTIGLVLAAQLYMLVRIWLGFGLTAGLLTWYERRFAPD